MESRIPHFIAGANPIGQSRAPGAHLSVQMGAKYAAPKPGAAAQGHQPHLGPATKPKPSLRPPRLPTIKKMA